MTFESHLCAFPITCVTHCTQANGDDASMHDTSPVLFTPGDNHIACHVHTVCISFAFTRKKPAVTRAKKNVQRNINEMCTGRSSEG